MLTFEKKVLHILYDYHFDRVLRCGCCCLLCCKRDLVSQTESNALRLGSDTDMARDRTFALALDAQVGQCILTEHGSRIHVG